MEKQNLNTTLVYVLSVLGFLCCCLAGFGLIPAGVAYLIANNKLKEAYADHERFENIQGMKTAKTVALVVLIVNVLYFALTCYRIYEMGGLGAFMDQINMAIEQAQQANG